MKSGEQKWTQVICVWNQMISHYGIKHKCLIVLSRFLSCCQYYKHFTIVNYSSGVVPDLKTLHIMALEL